MRSTTTTQALRAPIWAVTALFLVSFVWLNNYDAAGELVHFAHRSPRQASPVDVGDATRGALKLPVDEVWGNSSTLARHFRDHAADFGASTIDDYVGQGSAFFQRGLQQGLPTKIDADGIIRIYDPATNTFGAFNASGTIRTFFKPTSPTYWARQPGTSPW